jgi:hypothetical protein
LPIELERSDAMVVDDGRASEILEIARMTATERCMNYSQSQCKSAINECGSNIPFGLSQVTMLCNENVEIDFPADDDNCPRDDDHINLYAELIPLVVKEMCAVADLDCTAEERDHCKEAICVLSTMLKRNRAKGAPSGSMVSSSLKTNKCKTTHGTKHY